MVTAGLEQDLAQAFLQAAVAEDFSRVCSEVADQAALHRDRILLLFSVDQQALPHQAARPLNQTHLLLFRIATLWIVWMS